VVYQVVVVCGEGRKIRHVGTYCYIAYVIKDCSWHV
jgi:hypothetical protein